MTLGKLEDYWEVPFLSPSEGVGSSFHCGGAYIRVSGVGVSVEEANYLRATQMQGYGES